METLKDLTKKAMGYTEEKKVCQYCKYRIEATDIKGNEWDECSYFDLAKFKVQSHGSCNKWEKVQPKE